MSRPSLDTFDDIVHRASLAGVVRDAATQAPLAGAVVTIVSGPAAFTARLALLAIRHGEAWAKLAERADRTRSAADGSYRFIDLPDGGYQLKIEVVGGRYEAAAATAAVSADGQLQVMNIAVKPTLDAS